VNENEHRIRWLHPVFAPSRLIPSARRSFKENGFLYTVIRSAQVTIGCYISWTGWLFDRRYGTDTSGFVEHPSRVISDNVIYGTGYGPTPPNVFRRIMRKLNICFAENNMSGEAPRYTDFTFIDFGAGKGRVVLLALEYRFKKVIGIEYSAELYNNLVKNVQVYHRRFPKISPTELFLSDAVQFKFIIQGNKILYFYDPFGEIIMEKILNNLWNVVKSESPSPLVYVIYIPDRTSRFDVFLRNGFVITKRLRWTDFSGLRRDALIFQMMPVPGVGAK
jgi:hypothetical protein